jgi:hypothetical protein
MDRQSLAVLIPVITMFFVGLIAFSFTRLGRAVARRLEGGGTPDAMEQRIVQLEADQEQLHRALAEAHERLDFAERVLARDAPPPPLPRS